MSGDVAVCQKCIISQKLYELRQEVASSNCAIFPRLLSSSSTSARDRLCGLRVLNLLRCFRHQLSEMYNVRLRTADEAFEAAKIASLCLMAQWLGVGLVIERSLVRLPAGAPSSQPGQLSLPSLRGR